MPLVRHLFAVLGLLGIVTLTGCGGPATTEAPAATNAVSAVPKAVVRNAALDGGEVDLGRTYDYSFTVANEGKAPLRLTLSKKSCYCSEVTVPAQEIPPGGEDKVAVRWKPIPGSPTSYLLAVEVATNDPAQALLRLEIRATLKPLVQTYVPDNDRDPGRQYYVDFGDRPLRPDEGRQREVRVISTELTGFELDARCTHPGLEVLPPTPLQAGTRVGSVEIKSGYNVVIQATDKLPRGFIQEHLELTVKVRDQPPRVISMPVYATVENGTFVVTPERFVFRKPRITEGDSQKITVKYFVPRPNDKLEIARTEPSFLQATVQRIKDGVWQVTATLPANSAEAAKFQPDEFMEGRVILKSGDLEVPVRVKWDPSEKE